MTDCIYAAINREINNLESYIKRFDYEVTEDDIHDFRVSVKRLRAYRYFLRIINQSKFSIGSNLEMAYFAAGRHRDTTNKSNYLKHIKVAESEKDSDIEKLEKTKNVYLQELKSVLSSHSEILQPITDTLGSISKNKKEVLRSELNLIFNVAIANLKEELNKPDPYIDLHEVRKLYKKLSYLFELVNEFNPTGNSQKDQKIAVSIEKKLGTWHDIQILKLEEGNLKSINKHTIGKLEIKYGVNKRDDLIHLTRVSLKKFQLISVCP